MITLASTLGLPCVQYVASTMHLHSWFEIGTSLKASIVS